MKPGEKRQVIDFPKLVLSIVTEHVSMEGTCSCGCQLKGDFSKEATVPVVYDSNIHATVAYLSTLQNLPFKLLREALATLFNVKMSEGSVPNVHGLWI